MRLRLEDGNEDPGALMLFTPDGEEVGVVGPTDLSFLGIVGKRARAHREYKKQKQASRFARKNIRRSTRIERAQGRHDVVQARTARRIRNQEERGSGGGGGAYAFDPSQQGGGGSSYSPGGGGGGDYTPEEYYDPADYDTTGMQYDEIYDVDQDYEGMQDGMSGPITKEVDDLLGKLFQKKNRDQEADDAGKKLKGLLPVKSSVGRAKRKSKVLPVVHPDDPEHQDAPPGDDKHDDKPDYEKYLIPGLIGAGALLLISKS